MCGEGRGRRARKERIQWKWACRSLITPYSCDLSPSRMLSRALLSQKGREGRASRAGNNTKNEKQTEAQSAESNRDKVKRIIYHLVLICSLLYPTPPPSFSGGAIGRLSIALAFEDWLWRMRRTGLCQNKRSSNVWGVWRLSRRSLQKSRQGTAAA